MYVRFNHDKSIGSGVLFTNTLKRLELTSLNSLQFQENDKLFTYANQTKLPIAHVGDTCNTIKVKTPGKNYTSINSIHYTLFHNPPKGDRRLFRL